MPVSGRKIGEDWFEPALISALAETFGGKYRCRRNAGMQLVTAICLELAKPIAVALSFRPAGPAWARQRVIQLSSVKSSARWKKDLLA